MTNNPHAIRSTLTKKSIDFDLEQKPIQFDVNNSLNNDSNHEQKSAFKIPSPTILLPTELSSSSKGITSSPMSINKISRSTPSDSQRNLLIFNQPNSFYLKHSDEFIPTSDHTNRISSTQFDLSTRQSISQMSNEVLRNSFLPLSQDLKLLNDNEIISHVSPLEVFAQMKTHLEIKHESESLWKTKFTLKTLLAIANRDEAQALKNRKPIDYHMFLSNKWKKSSILQYQDSMERKFTENNKHSIIEQVNEEENRKLYKRLLNTMSIGKPRKIESIKPKKTKRRTRIKSSAIIQEDSLPSLTDEPDKPILITYEAKPISLFTK